MFQIQVKADIFVGGVSACIGVTQAHRRNGQFQVMDERVIGARSANRGDKFHRCVVNICRSIHNDFDEGVIGVGSRRRFAAEEIDLHIVETLRIKMGAEFFDDVFGHLRGHESKIHFG